MRKTRIVMETIILGLICVVALAVCISFSIKLEEAPVAYAVEIVNSNETRIDGWRNLQSMTTYGRNTDYACGITAMAVLLQFYNDNSRWSQEILPDDFNYNLDAGGSGNNIRANALRGYDGKDKNKRGEKKGGRDEAFI